VNTAPPKPTKFDPDAATEGNFPKPPYPGIALRNRYQGTTTLEMMVDTSGQITSVKVVKSSGYPVLDEAALQWVKGRWRPKPGQSHYWVWDCTFQLK
jgi:protein TonB